MTVVDSTKTINEISIIPRNYTKGVIKCFIDNNEVNVYVTSDYGYLNFDLTYTFVKGNQYQLKLTENNTIVFRGLITAI